MHRNFCDIPVGSFYFLSVSFRDGNGCLPRTFLVTVMTVYWLYRLSFCILVCGVFTLCGYPSIELSFPFLVIGYWDIGTFVFRGLLKALISLVPMHIYISRASGRMNHLCHLTTEITFSAATRRSRTCMSQTTAMTWRIRHFS